MAKLDLSKKDEEPLTVCSSCEKIRVDEAPGGWLDREGNQTIYDSLMKQYGDNLDHGYCGSCKKKKLEEDVRNYVPTHVNKDR